MRRLALLVALIAAPGLHAREVAFESAGYRLVGTLDVPAKEARGGVLIIPGSGPIDRDGVLRVAPDRPPIYRNWGEAFAQAGYLVLRFDKRTVTHPGIDYTSFDEDAQIGDALAAAAFLRSQPGVRRVFLVGHSEGGTLATVMAARGGIAGLVVVNSVQFPVDELLLAQLKNLPTVSKSDYDAVERTLERIKAGSFPKGRLLLGASGPYWAQWIAYSQRSPVTLGELAMPVLLVQCLDDESLPGDTLKRNLELLRAVARTNKNAQLRELSGHDHSALRNGKASPQFTRTLVEWLDRLP